MSVGLLSILFSVCCFSISCMASISTEWNFNSGSQQVWFGNDMIHESYIGKKSIEYNATFDVDSQYRICSNSKMFTTVAILQLMEQGVLGSIYDNINLYLNETDMVAWGYPTGTTSYCPMVVNTTTCQNITFLSLMSMSSGIIASITCTYAPTDWQYEYCLSPLFSNVYQGSIANTISAFIQHPLQSVPGPGYDLSTDYNSYVYSNENFIILSYFVEKYSQMSLSNYFQRYIFDIIGMENTVYDPYSREFNIGTQMNLGTEYYYYTDLTSTANKENIANNVPVQPFAYGDCAFTEFNPGVQNGAGGLISTVPDMVKWYSSLFITKNTTVLLQSSLDLMLFPWAIDAVNPNQYYGLANYYLQKIQFLCPPFGPMSPIMYYYNGGSMCTFFTIILYNTSVNILTGEDNLVSIPMISVAARNNRILNVTESVWTATQNEMTGTWFTLTGWSSGWGESNGDLTDTFYAAINPLLYLAAIPAADYTTSPSMQPTSSVDPNSNDDSSCSMETGRAVTAVLVATLVPCVFVMAVMLTYFCLYWGPKKTSTSGPMHTREDDSSINKI